MSIGKLELGEVEQTSYVDPVNGREIFIKFRHPSDGDAMGSFTEAGLQFELQSDGKNKLFLKGKEGDDLAAIPALETANIILAKSCILEAQCKEDGSKVETNDIYDRALLQIGEYLRKESNVSEVEKKD